MATLKAANVTKYDAGGSGDNYVKDGYIKTVEKVWLDTYTPTAAISTADSIIIARIPAWRKLTDITVEMPAIGVATTGTVSFHLGASRNSTGTAGSLGLARVFNDSTAYFASSACTLKIPQAGILQSTSTITNLHMQFDTYATTLTAGTIKSIVKYT